MDVGGGATFSDAVTLSDELINTGSHSPAVSGNDVYVVWTERDSIVLRKSVDGGANY